jgi:DNA (cytosine-5)-methyltransferase 1
MKVVGLFAGIGGIELGLRRSGHDTALLCEIDPGAKAVLEDRFKDLSLHDDVRTLRSLPSGTELIAAGFPCQDLSQAGKTAGIEGARSGLVGEVVRLIEQHDVPWVLLENVPFMLQLSAGRAMEVIVEAFERLGYHWAYRVVDSRSFGLPQRRERVYFLASKSGDPREVLFADDAGEPTPRKHAWSRAHGFYWTEGVRGLGWAKADRRSASRLLQRLSCQVEG